MIHYNAELDKMKKYFPSHTDIRKRINSSVGGAMLHAMAKEADDIQATIEEYKKDFFLLCYLGKEDTIPSHLYITLIGYHDEITVPGLDVTEDVMEFYQNLDSKVLYQDGCLIADKSALDDTTQIEYIVDDTYTYKNKLEYQHVWNVFDEFALFAGLKRYDNEKNSELAWRTLQVFKAFPNASEQGLKNAIKNALINIDDIDDEQITIEKPTVENLALPDDAYKDIYEHITQYNKDLLRVKNWDTTLWEHPFKKLAMLAHPWDIKPAEYQDGVGHSDSLKVDYLSNINAEDTTDVEVVGYEKDHETIREYIRNNNIETSVLLKLIKYENEITPRKLEYKITASDVEKINPYNIEIEALQHSSGTTQYDLSDFVTELQGVTEVPRNILAAGKKYELDFLAKSSYSSMEIFKCEAKQNGVITDLRRTGNGYELKNNVLVNTDVLLHATSTDDLKSFDNIKNVDDGFTLDSSAQEGHIELDIEGMSQASFNYNITCDEVNVTDNSAIVTPSKDFILSSDGKSLTCNTTDSLNNIIIKISNCSSYSFELAAGSDEIHQGAVVVTTAYDNESNQQTYTAATKISKQFDKTKDVKIVIQKYGQNPVTIRNIRAARYKITVRTKIGEIRSNPMYSSLPAFSGKNTLLFDITALTARPPVIHYIHIGNSLFGANYKVKVDATAGAVAMDIDSNCNVRLFDITSGSKQLIDSDYSTKPQYVNNTISTAYIIVDLSSFMSIQETNPAIHHKYQGTAKDYIEIAPGQTIDKITIKGDSLKVIERKSLYELLINGTTGQEIYVSRATTSFIVKDGINTKLVDINRDMLNAKADSFRVTGILGKLTAVFLLDIEKNIQYIDRQISRSFERMCLLPVDKNEYVAYNDTYMISTEKRNIPLINVFNPLISFTKTYFYQISDVKSQTDPTASALFIHEDGSEENWSFGVPRNGIVARTKLEFGNTETYELNISQVYNKYILSNEIPLEDKYYIGDSEHWLKEYIIETPEGIQVDNLDEETEELIYIENDGFNKLQYSNVQIRSIELSSGALVEQYEVLNKEGILIWHDRALYGKAARVSYIVQKPVSLSYSDDDVLYKEISYNVNAYRQIPGSINIFKRIKDGTCLALSFPKKADKVIVRLSNEGFQATVNPDKTAVNIIQMKKTNKLAYHNGYIYEDGLEYYMFCDKFRDEVARMDHVELINVSRLGDRLLFRMKSSNFLPHSNMATKVLAPLCCLDFRKKRFEDVSKLQKMTACESFNGWYSYNMDVNLGHGHNGLGIALKTKDRGLGYALLDVTDFIEKGNILSLWTMGELSVGLAKETLIDNMPFTKSICIEKEDIQLLKKRGEYRYMIFKESPQQETRYYLIVEGNGIIDDIVAKKHTNLYDMEKSHVKNIDRLGIEIEEKMLPSFIRHLEFDELGAKYVDLEVSGNGIITTAMNVEWGLTHLAAINLSECKIYDGDLEKDRIIAYRSTKVITEPIYLRSKNSIEKTVVKINDVFADELKGFVISVYSSVSRKGGYNKIFSVKDSNIAELPKHLLNNYVKIEIEAKQGKIINSIDVYAKYIESDESILAVFAKEAGSLVTKIYDLGTAARFKLNNIEFESNQPQNVQFYIRGCRENRQDFEFTQWHKYEQDKTQRELNPVILDNYELLQFKIELTGKDTKALIHGFDMEVL